LPQNAPLVESALSALAVQAKLAAPAL